MTDRLTTQLVVRVPDDLRAALEADAAANGRTLAQTVRFLLRQAVPSSLGGEPQPGTDDNGLVWCVKHRDGSCATRDNHEPAEGTDNIPTRCGFWVVLPAGYDRREPDCSDCRTPVPSAGGGDQPDTPAAQMAIERALGGAPAEYPPPTCPHCKGTRVVVVPLVDPNGEPNPDLGPCPACTPSPEEGTP